MIFTKIILTKFTEKLRKLSFIFFCEIQQMKHVCKKTKKLAKIELLSLYHLKSRIPTALGLNKVKFWKCDLVRRIFIYFAKKFHDRFWTSPAVVHRWYKGGGTKAIKYLADERDFLFSHQKILICVYQIIFTFTWISFQRSSI